MTTEQLQQIYQWWHVFKNEQDLVEIRVVGEKVTYSGYYKDINNLIRDVDLHINDNVYFTINPINDALHGRPQCENMLKYAKNTTTDNEVIGRSWVFIDIDYKKIANVNSTNKEKEIAHQRTLKIYKYLKQEGFNDPVVVDSANSYHLYYPCKLKANEENNNLVKRFTLALGMLFSDEEIDVDAKVYNLSRIAKLPGTFSRKGSALSSDRPQRMCKILHVPNEIIPIQKDYFLKVANLYPADQIKPSSNNNYSTERFNLVEFLTKHNISYKIENVADGTKYILDHCVFNEQHKGKDAMIFQRNNGAISYYCFHSGCSQYKWSDVRVKFEPDAYKKDYQEYKNKQKRFEKYKEPTPLKDENPQDGKKWLKMRDIKTIQDGDLVAIRTGFTLIDNAIKGQILGEVTLLSGINASGKTVLLNTLALNAVQQGFKTAMWSGELQDHRLKGWIMQTAAGKYNVQKIQGVDNAYEVKEECISKIEDWLDDKFYLYNNNYGSNWTQLLSDIKQCISDNNIKYIILDNLMSIDMSDINGGINEQQKRLILDLSDLAKRENIHILIVAHPRKEANFTLLRKESISGTADLTNVIQNLFLIHRVGDDFIKRASEFWRKERVEDMMMFNNVIEIAKNRSYGVVDYVVGLYYEQETRRFKNTISETIHYDWEQGFQNEEYTEVVNPIMAGIKSNMNFDISTFPIIQKESSVYDEQFKNDNDLPF